MRASAIITAPLNPAYSSLNLGQSVLLVAWEWLKAGDTTPAVELPTGDSPPATQAAIDGLLAHLNQELDAANFFRSPDQRPATQQNIYNVFARARMTEQETKTLRGIIARIAALRRKMGGRH